MEGVTRHLSLLLLLLPFCLAQDCSKEDTYISSGQSGEVASLQTEQREAVINIFLKAERKRSFKGIHLDIQGGKAIIFFKLGGCFKRDGSWKELRAWVRVEEEEVGGGKVKFGVEVGSCAMSCAVDGLNTSLTPLNLTMAAYGSSSWVNSVSRSCRVLYLAYTTPSPQTLPACLQPPVPGDPSFALLICVATILCFLAILFVVAALYCKFYASKK